MPMNTSGPLFLLLFFFASTSFAEDQMTPGGLVYAQSFWGTAPLTENRMKINIQRDPGNESSYFWAQQFFYNGSNEGGYIGLQTGGIQKGRLTGKLFIFSVWNVKSAEAGEGAVCEPFGGEGEGMKCTLAFDWKESEDYAVAVTLKNGHLTGTVQEMRTGNVHSIGTIPLPHGHSALSNGSLIWIEYFGNISGTCAKIPSQSAVFTPLTSNGLHGRLTNVTFGRKCANAEGRITEDASSATFTSGGATGH